MRGADDEQGQREPQRALDEQIARGAVAQRAHHDDRAAEEDREGPRDTQHRARGAGQEAAVLLGQERPEGVVPEGEPHAQPHGQDAPGETYEMPQAREGGLVEHDVQRQEAGRAHDGDGEGATGPRHGGRGVGVLAGVLVGDQEDLPESPRQAHAGHHEEDGDQHRARELARHHAPDVERGAEQQQRDDRGAHDERHRALETREAIHPADGLLQQRGTRDAAAQPPAPDAAHERREERDEQPHAHAVRRAYPPPEGPSSRGAEATPSPAATKSRPTSAR